MSKLLGYFSAQKLTSSRSRVRENIMFYLTRNFECFGSFVRCLRVCESWSSHLLLYGPCQRSDGLSAGKSLGKLKASPSRKRLDAELVKQTTQPPAKQIFARPVAGVWTDWAEMGIVAM